MMEKNTFALSANCNSDDLPVKGKLRIKLQKLKAWKATLKLQYKKIFQQFHLQTNISHPN